MENIVAEEIQNRLEDLENHHRLDCSQAVLYFKNLKNPKIILSNSEIAEAIALPAPGQERVNLDYYVYLHSKKRNELVGKLQARTGKGRICLTYTQNSYPDVPDVFIMSMVSGVNRYEGIASRNDYQWPNHRKDEACKIFTAFRSA